MAKLLLIEDDDMYATLITDCLKAEKHVVELAGTLLEAEELLSAFQYDLLVIDWQLPDGNGISFIRKLRKTGRTLPILMLTVRDGMGSKEEGFDSGADDYLAKTAQTREIVVRIKALLRRPGDYKQAMVSVGDIEIDFGGRVITKAGQKVHLYPKEFLILEYLLKNPGRVFSAEELLERLWPSDTDATSHTVRSCVNRIRAKLDDAKSDSLIETVHKSGYKLNQRVGEKPP